MFYFKIRLADKNIEVECFNRHVVKIFRDYFAAFDNPDLVVKISWEEVKSEAKKVYGTNYVEQDPSDKIACEYVDSESLLIQKKIVNELIRYSIILMHGAAIATDNKCYIFTAPSGTGKTTHIQNWLECIQNTIVVNGDKPLIDVSKKLVYGTPWCGKEGMNTNTAVPLAGIIELKRGKNNTIRAVPFRNMLPVLLRQIHIPNFGSSDFSVYHLINCLKDVPCYQLTCNMDRESAIVAYNGLVVPQCSEVQ